MRISKCKFFNSSTFLNFLIMGIFVGLFSFIIFWIVGYNQYEQNAFEEINYLIQNKTKLIENYINHIDKEFSEVYDEKLFVDFLKMDNGDIDYNLVRDKILTKFSSYGGQSMGLTNSSGIIVLDEDDTLIGFDINSYPESVRYLKYGGPEITYRVLPHPFEDRFYLLLSQKIYDNASNFVGIFSYRLLDNSLKKLFEDVNGFEGIAESYLINKDFVLVTPSKHLSGSDHGIVSQIVNTSNSIECLNLVSNPFMEKGYILGNISLYNSYWGGDVFGAYSAINRVDWCLFLELDKDDFINNNYKSLFFLGLIVFFGVVLFFIFLSFLEFKKIVHFKFYRFIKNYFH